MDSVEANDSEVSAVVGDELEHDHLLVSVAGVLGPLSSRVVGIRGRGAVESDSLNVTLSSSKHR